MPKSIFDLVSAPMIGTYYTEVASNNISYLGSFLFPAKKQLGLDLSWIRGHNGLPVSLAPAAFDAKAPVRDRIGVTKIETEMPFFRESFRIGEKERQELLKVSAGMNAEMVKPIINKIYDDAKNLIDGSDVVAERMRMQLLSTGRIDISAENAPYKYDYKLPAKHRVTLSGTAKWSDTAAANPISDIMDWKEQVEMDTGEAPTRAICTRKTWKYLLGNEKIRLDLNPVGGQNIIMTDALLKSYLLEKLQLQVSVYNKMYAPTQYGAGEKFFPDDTFTLFPAGRLGTTYYGTTPEEADLMSGQKVGDVSIVNTGIAVLTYKEVHPVNSVTVVSGIMLPSFEAIDKIFIAKVG